MRLQALLLAGLAGLSLSACGSAELDSADLQSAGASAASAEPGVRTPVEPAPEAIPSLPTPEPASSAGLAAAPLPAGDPMSSEPNTDPARELATFGAGCFWCVEAVLEQQNGVLDVTSGYMGGHVENPTYKQVCTGSTGHAEVVQVTFDPAVLPYPELLDLFWRLHDPTTLNRQGADVGTQYRSAIYYHSDAQRAAAEASKAQAQLSFRDPIVTEITPASTYYVAEEDHQDYYRENSSAGYCRAVIAPKLKKLGLEY